MDLEIAVIGLPYRTQ